MGKAFPRQANWNGNGALTYAKGIVSSRGTMQYNGPYIYTIGDGTRSVATGDTYMLAHKQIDASLNAQVQRNTQLVLQVLNINNAPFGYYFGGDPNAYKQREFYGTTTSLQLPLHVLTGAVTIQPCCTPRCEGSVEQCSARVPHERDQK